MGIGGAERRFVPHTRLLPALMESEESDLSPSGWEEGVRCLQSQRTRLKI
jgi:hypothetical protein